MTAINEVYANAAANYAKVTGKWSSDKYGPAPTGELLVTAYALTQAVLNRAQYGVETAHIALCLRPEGCHSQSQFEAPFRCGPAFNKMRKLIEAGLVKRVTPAKGTNVLSLTKAGEKAVERFIKGTIEGDKPAKPAKAKSKARKQVEPQVEATVEPVIEPVS
jgi:hypothetical protein